jgi:hypothetical protein
MNKCPRCYEEMNETNTIGCGALSRYDNKTMVCSKCGREEADEWAYGLAPKGFDPRIAN